MKPGEFWQHPGDHSYPICAMDGAPLAPANIRYDGSGTAKCGICGVALDLYEVRLLKKGTDT